ncbi:nicotinamide riboside kinase 2-like isoform X1 [Sinocyclocheilus anshuiensis]|uniref:nicotinamide riboside kinase 2-like isoform X1 n=2 Tax=Sinocyclocheilus anshuiensis TaxID=1608454 RepID=UPI0007BAD115|nr:PREDICTED: nicotinamide riboside kinase 2-like isoform X1 [Sinocyclocheilus anshuiensis]
MKFIIGIGGVTNGGKTTLTGRLIKNLPNCCVVHQDDFFKPQDQIELGEDGFKQWDVITALDMDAMVNTVKGWMENPVKFARSHGVTVSPASDGSDPEREIHILVIEGFLLYNYKPLLDIYSKCYYVTIPYGECKRRRSMRTYTVPDPPGLFDGHVWPMYLKHRLEMENSGQDIRKSTNLALKWHSVICNSHARFVSAEYLDGMRTKDELYNQVYEDIQNSLLNVL